MTNLRMGTWYTACTVLVFTGRNCTGLFTPSVSKLHLVVAKLCLGWLPTCNGTVLSRRLLSPEWDKNFDVFVPPFSKPIHCQLDPPAGEYLFVSMAINKKGGGWWGKTFRKLPVLLTESLMKRQNKQLSCHSYPPFLWHACYPSLLLPSGGLWS